MNYTSQLNQIEEEIDVAEKGPIELETQDITGFSLVSDSLKSGRSSYRAFFDSMIKYHDYTPGEATSIPVKQGETYGLGLDIDAGDRFGEQDFEEMMDSLWEGEFKGYSWVETAEKIEEWHDLRDIDQVKTVIRDLPGLILMKCYKPLSSHGLEKSYSVDENSFGVRFYDSDEGNIINVSADVKTADRVLENARKISRYLDGEIDD